MQGNPAAVPYFGYAFIGFGILLAAIAGYLVFAALRLRATARRAEGTVVRLVSITRSDSEGYPITTIHPVVIFPTEAGPVQFQGRVGSSPSPFTVGEKVTVLYDPDKPNDAQILGFGQQFILPLILVGAGSVVALVGCLTLMASSN